MASENAEIKYFCDILHDRADKAVEKYGCGTAVYDYHEILDDPEFDAVSVCTQRFSFDYFYRLYASRKGHSVRKTRRENTLRGSRNGKGFLRNGQIAFYRRMQPLRKFGKPY